MSNNDALRKAAERITKAVPMGNMSTRQQQSEYLTKAMGDRLAFQSLATPQAVVSLLDEIEQLRAALAASRPEPVGINGLTEAKTAATASVMGLTRIHKADPDKERADLIRKLRRDCLWIPGKHYVTQLEEIMDEAAAVLSAAPTPPAQPAETGQYVFDVEQMVDNGGDIVWFRASSKPAESEWEKKLREEIDHAITNDLRLAPAFGRITGEPAVRISDLEAIIDYMAHARRSAQPAEAAKQRYDRLMEGENEPSALERLRFFCSLAMNGQDWLDVEEFFTALEAQPAERKPLTDEQRMVLVEVAQMFSSDDRRRRVLNSLLALADGIKGES